MGQGYKRHDGDPAAWTSSALPGGKDALCFDLGARHVAALKDDLRRVESRGLAVEAITQAVFPLAPVAQEIARVPANEISAPVHRAVFPGYAKLAADREDLRHAYLRVASLLVLIVVPAGTGLALLAEPAVTLLLGSAWTAAVPLVELLAFNAILNVLLGSGHYVNLAVGMARSTSAIAYGV